MSRWSDQFSKHAIHDTLRQAQEHLYVEAEEIDGEHESEKRRLEKALEAIISAVEGLDQEFYPEALLTQLNNHLLHQNFINQLQSYSSKQNSQHLKTANNHIDSQIGLIYNLKALSRTPESRKAINSTEHAFDNFCKIVEKKKKDFEKHVAESDSKLDQINKTVADLSESVEGLKSTTETTLGAWQKEFTDAQTGHEKQFSDAQIQRGKEFDSSLREWRTNSETEIKDISAKHDSQLKSAFDTFEKEVADRSTDIQEKHQSILDIHGLVANDGVAGGYTARADAEHEAANLWRWIAMGSLGAAAIWVFIKFWLFGGGSAKDFNWGDIITSASLTLVLLAAAGYASRQSRLHRESELHMRWFSLEVTAIDPFMASLPPEIQNELKKQLSERLFGQDRVNSNKSNENVDPNAIKTIAEAMTALKDFVGKQS